MDIPHNWWVFVLIGFLLVPVIATISGALECVFFSTLLKFGNNPITFNIIRAFFLTILLLLGVLLIIVEFLMQSSYWLMDWSDYLDRKLDEKIGG